MGDLTEAPSLASLAQKADPRDWSTATLAIATLVALIVILLLYRARKRYTAAIAERRRTQVDVFCEANLLISDWLNDVSQLLVSAREEHRWITHEQQQRALLCRPTLPVSEDELQELFKEAHVRAATAETDQSFETRLRYWKADWPAAWAAVNEQHTRHELVACRELFDQVESRPLTEEQARAAICFDNRVQVVAAAGSGKTSTMIAKAAYAIHRGLAQPEAILLLAFNRKAAEELRERAAQSFARLGWGERHRKGVHLPCTGLGHLRQGDRPEAGRP